jgi:hypothetical protein
MSGREGKSQVTTEHTKLGCEGKQHSPLEGAGGVESAAKLSATGKLGGRGATVVSGSEVDRSATMAVHMERRLQAWIQGTPYDERYKLILLSQISPNLEHAVVSAQDMRFYEHHGFDWHQVQIDAAGIRKARGIKGRRNFSRLP